MKLFDSYKRCIIDTEYQTVSQNFSSEWTFKDIEAYMLEKYKIDKDAIITMQIISVTNYKVKR